MVALVPIGIGLGLLLIQPTTQPAGTLQAAMAGLTRQYRADGAEPPSDDSRVYEVNGRIEGFMTSPADGHITLSVRVRTGERLRPQKYLLESEAELLKRMRANESRIVRELARCPASHVRMRADLERMQADTKELCTQARTEIARLSAERRGWYEWAELAISLPVGADGDYWSRATRFSGQVTSVRWVIAPGRAWPVYQGRDPAELPLPERVVPAACSAISWAGRNAEDDDDEDMADAGVEP